MAKGKRKSRRPQAQHNRKRGPSQHDKRERLSRCNPNRRATAGAKVPLTGALRAMVLLMQTLLDRRIAFRLGIIVAGMIFADGRRTASAWFVAAGVGDDWDRFYDAINCIGRQSERLGVAVLGLVLAKIGPKTGERLLLAIDDTPSERYGRHVEGAGVHHDPTPGPAGGAFLYGHSWVTLAVVAKHSLWGVIALPVRALLYVRAMDIPKLASKYDWPFRTKHALAAELVLWCAGVAWKLGVTNKVWVATDGGYTARPFLDPLRKKGVVVVSRLRKDSRLFDLPPERTPGQRGRPRIYGEHRISLAKRAAHRHGWESVSYACRGKQVTRQCKTFLATSRLVGGQIRVVLVRFPDDGWAAYFCTDPNASMTDILETVASRWALEEHFHDVKEVWGAGQQQVRNVWSNLGCWHLNQWLYSLIELCTWDAAHATLSDRKGRPWDSAERRPSHADRRRRTRREMLEKQFHTTLPEADDDPKTQSLIETDLRLCL